MEEKVIWKGNSSQVINLGTYVVCFLLIWLIVPLFVAIWRWIENRCRIYEITTERIRITRGVFNKRTDELELYRAKDTTLVEPFLYRLAGAGNIVITTIDVSTPGLTIEAVKSAPAIREELRKHVEDCRDRKRVRVAELDEPL
ncbi:MAG TPA: PH domain-containing protein [Verrucomicrobia bacterium]|nr:PH domain-containing protein [Verrucomicrobiota bacterium]HOP98476.1 PH domain-containing protein [Verrucomicrobiota bacterium]